MARRKNTAEAYEVLLRIARKREAQESEKRGPGRDGDAGDGTDSGPSAGGRHLTRRDASARASRRMVEEEVRPWRERRSPVAPRPRTRPRAAALRLLETDAWDDRAPAAAARPAGPAARAPWLEADELPWLGAEAVPSSPRLAEAVPRTPRLAEAYELRDRYASRTGGLLRSGPDGEAVSGPRPALAFGPVEGGDSGGSVAPASAPAERRRRDEVHGVDPSRSVRRGGAEGARLPVRAGAAGNPAVGGAEPSAEGGAAYSAEGGALVIGEDAPVSRAFALDPRSGHEGVGGGEAELPEMIDRLAGGSDDAGDDAAASAPWWRAVAAVPVRFVTWLAGGRLAGHLERRVEISIATVVIGFFATVITLSLIGIWINSGMRPPVDTALLRERLGSFDAPAGAAEAPSAPAAAASSASEGVALRIDPRPVTPPVWSPSAADRRAPGEEVVAVSRSEPTPPAAEAPSALPPGERYWICLQAMQWDWEADRLVDYVRGTLVPHFEARVGRDAAGESVGYKQAVAVPMATHEGLFEVFVGPFASRKEASAAADEVKKATSREARLEYTRPDFFARIYPRKEPDGLADRLVAQSG